MRLSIEQLDRRVGWGWLRKQRHPGLPLSIYTYTDLCAYHGNWDDYTRVARGVVVDDLGTVVSKPFEKFFNYGESHCPDIPPNLSYEVFEKVDGSMLQAFWYRGQWILATRGSFVNQYVDYAQRYLSYFTHFPTNWTIVCELCVPEDVDGLRRAVIHEPGVYLLGACDTYSGKDLAYSKILEYGWSGKKPKIYNHLTIDHLRTNQESMEATEGWVVRFANGIRIKFKTAWYFRLFRAISQFDKQVWEGMVGGLSKKQILAGIPEELRDEAGEMWSRLHFAARMLEYELLGELIKHWHDDQKTFALGIERHPDKHLLFSLYNGHSIRETLLKDRDRLLTKLT